MAKKKKIFPIMKLMVQFFVLSFIGLLSWASFWWADYSNPMDNIEINFSETKVLDINQYKSLLDEITNNDSSKLDLYEISALIENHPYIKVARVSRHYPSEIKIEIIEREPIAIVNIEPMIFLDENGFVLPDEGNIKNYNLPVMNNFNSDPKLYPQGELALSVKVKECVVILSRIQTNYPELYNNLSYLEITSSNEIKLILDEFASNLPTHVYLGNNEIYARIEILKEFESTLKPNKISDFSYLDMRFNNQIIVKRHHS